MPTILRVGRYSFYFFSNEGMEPAHIHVKAAGDQAKFWLDPVGLAANYGFRGHELTDIERIVRERRAFFLEAWYEHRDED